MAPRFLPLLWLAVALAPALAAQSPEPRNLLSRDLPEWLDLGVTMRTRVESRRGLNYAAPFDDSSLLNRARFEVAVRPAESWRVFAQLQDSRSVGLAEGRSRTGTDDPVDIRQLWVEAGAEPRREGWRLRLGRQRLIFGDERILAERNWNNVAPTWDGARFALATARDRVDLFAVAQVDNDPDDIDGALSGTRVAGFYGSIGSALDGARIEPYWFYNDRPRISGVLFDSAAGIHTYGARLAGEFAHNADYDLEITGQRGHAVGLRQSGWSGYCELGLRPFERRWKPRLFAIYERASGDRDPGDGRSGTFDSGLGKRHSHLGAADAVGRSNLSTLETGVEAAPSPSLSLRLAYHRFHVASRFDGVYRTNGLIAVRAPEGGASASRIGDEVDLILKWAPPAGWWSLEGGYGRFFAGPFLEDSFDRTVRRSILYISFEWSL